jgi:hypothetical protein
LNPIQVIADWSRTQFHQHFRATLLTTKSIEQSQ